MHDAMCEFFLLRVFKDQGCDFRAAPVAAKHTSIKVGFKVLSNTDPTTQV
jgi:hypothetical protein